MLTDCVRKISCGSYYIDTTCRLECLLSRLPSFHMPGRCGQPIPDHLSRIPSHAQCNRAQYLWSGPCITAKDPEHISKSTSKQFHGKGLTHSTAYYETSRPHGGQRICSLTGYHSPLTQAGWCPSVQANTRMSAGMQEAALHVNFALSPLFPKSSSNHYIVTPSNEVSRRYSRESSALFFHSSGLLVAIM